MHSVSQFSKGSDNSDRLFATFVAMTLQQLWSCFARLAAVMALFCCSCDPSAADLLRFLQFAVLDPCIHTSQDDKYFAKSDLARTAKVKGQLNHGCSIEKTALPPAD